MTEPGAAERSNGTPVTLGAGRAMGEPSMALGWGLLWAAVAGSSFHVAHLAEGWSSLIVVFVGSLFQLSRLSTVRQAFYLGAAAGVAVYTPYLAFFWGIFGIGAVVLWSVLPFWLGCFTALAWSCRRRGGATAAVVLAPFLWTGIEYFRSELYYLRFSWLSPGYAFAEAPQVVAWAGAGVYGVGFLLAAAMVWPALLPVRIAAVIRLGLVAALTVIARWPGPADDLEASGPRLSVAGVQLEFALPPEVVAALDELVREHPSAELLVLSEYAFDGPVPESVRAWCRANGRFLIAGGRDPIPAGGFYNTAFVIGPDGKEIFRQAKSVPIQFFQDGQPAARREIWESPWGRLGICICYDLSYRRVVDEFVRQGAQALIVPTMDALAWGQAEHDLHARVGPVRAAEYGMPLFRLCSSGVSQAIDRAGRVRDSAPYPGQGATLAAELRLPQAGRLPWDRFLAPVSVGITVLVGLVGIWGGSGAARIGSAG